MKIRQGFVSNSSSSSFICDTKMNAEEIETQLRKMLDGFNMMMDTNYKFEDCFCNPYMVSGKIHEGFEEYYPCLKNAKGKIAIDSVDDNSIPYEMIVLIESKFNTTHCHLG